MITRVLFLRDTLPEEHGAGPSFVAGQVATLRPDSAAHWKNLGAATDAPPEVVSDAEAAANLPGLDPASAPPPDKPPKKSRGRA